MSEEKKEKEIKYSYSRLETYDQCPFRYWLKYIEKHYATTSSIAFDFGTLVHKTEETIGNCIKDGKQINYDELIQNFASKCTEIEQKYPKEFNEPDKNGRTYTEKINGYLNNGIYRLEKFMQANSELEIIETEKDFTFRYNGCQAFRGAIDRILRNKITGQYIVQDIKTYGAPIDQEKLKTPLQFVIYCMAMSETYPVDPTMITCQYDLPLCNLTQDAGTKGFIARGRTKLSKLFGKIDEKDWTPKATPLCAFCEFCLNNESAGKDTKFLCPYFCHWTRANKVFTKENDWTKIDDYPVLLEAFHKVNGIE